MGLLITVSLQARDCLQSHVQVCMSINQLHMFPARAKGSCLAVPNHQKCASACRFSSLLLLLLCAPSELVAGIMAWFKLEQKPVNKADIKKLFDAFMDRVARYGMSSTYKCLCACAQVIVGCC